MKTRCHPANHKKQNSRRAHTRVKSHGTLFLVLFYYCTSRIYAEFSRRFKKCKMYSFFLLRLKEIDLFKIYFQKFFMNRIWCWGSLNFTYNFYIIIFTNLPFYSIVLCRVIDCFCWQTVRFRERWPPPQRFLKTTQESEIGEKKCRKL